MDVMKGRTEDAQDVSTLHDEVSKQRMDKPGWFGKTLRRDERPFGVKRWNLHAF